MNTVLKGLIHGLICCKNGCGYWNRNVNGSTNNKERPTYLSRSNTITHQVYTNYQNQNLHAMRMANLFDF